MNFDPYPMRMSPFYSERPWGGRLLSTLLGKDVPDQGGPYGEAWELSDHPKGRSRIANGPYAGRTFGEVVRAFPEQMCGTAHAPQRFPLLIKYIDAGEDLSIQVHPDEPQARAYRERGKTECWYVMACRPGTQVILGLKAGVDIERLRRCAENGHIESCIRRVEIRPGDFIPIQPGTVHAILGGTLLCEIQQASDCTFRLWDWNRQPPRPLHVEDACLVTRLDGKGADNIRNVRELPPMRWHRLVRNAFFQVRVGVVAAGASFAGDRLNPHGQALNVIEGGGRLIAGGIDQRLAIGQTWFLPAGMVEWSLVADDAGLGVLLSESMELAGSKTNRRGDVEDADIPT